MPTVEEIKAKYQQQLLQLPDVVSVGIGLSPDGEKVIVLGLAGKVPDTDCRVPTTLEGYDVQTRVTGTPQLQPK